ncbi:GDP-mannose-dependent alpha-(1-6)-phosphatidylinositol monomannoside mannosyltransferase [Aeromonas hydrophila]|nr:GDP-mannose-dependent alpha-(1-6)-phosphatidylinositol monomannoside mannosyltransferase [Aeromonas hydrophila]
MKKVIVFGAGGLFRVFLPFIKSRYQLAAISDNDTTRHGQFVDGVRIVSPSDIICLDFELVIVASMYFEEIKEKLISLGINNNSIVNIYVDLLIRESVANYLNEHDEFLIAVNKIASLSLTKKRLIVMNSLGNGGAERALLNLCRRIEEKEKIFLIVIEGGGEYFDALSHILPVVEIFSSTENRLLSRCFFMHFSANDICARLFGQNEYDIAIAYIEGLSTYLVSGINSNDKVACVHANLFSHHISAPYYASLKAEYDAYANMDRLIFVSNSVKNGFNERIGLRDYESNVIGNIFDIEVITNNSNMENDSQILYPYIVAVGRLVEVKGFDKLIRAFTKIKKNGQEDLKLVIIGDGPLKSALDDLISTLGMKEHIILLGKKENPYPYIKSAQCLVSSSVSEGHPLSIGEAIILGTPIIATCCEGNIGLLAHGRYGYLCENDEDGLASALYSLSVIPMHYATLIFKSTDGQNSLSGENEINQWNEMLSGER